MNINKAKELLPVIQAISEGLKIQVKVNNIWLDVDANNNCVFLPEEYDYRIKPELKYRPFKDAEECWQEMLKHQPFGYTYDRFNNIRDSITKVATTGVSYDSPTVISFKEIFDRFVFADGVPFGMKEE